jgi:hypothetical protein
MTGTYITDVTNYLDEFGDISIESGAGLRFVEYLTAIISMISHPQPLPEEFKAKCRRRPNRKPCNGTIQGKTYPNTDVIVWWCPKCRDNGFINNWKGTFWDLSDNAENTHH